MKPTRLGLMRPLVTGGIGFDPDTADIPVPIDHASADDGGFAWYPVSGGGTTAVVQSKATTDIAGFLDVPISFDAAVTAGSLLVALAVNRASEEAATAVGWTAFPRIDANGFAGGSGTVLYRIATGEEGTGPFTFAIPPAGGQRRLVIVEFSGPNQFIDRAEVDEHAATTSYNLGVVTPTAGAPTLLIAAALNGWNLGGGDITGVTGYTTISNGQVGGPNGPTSILAYKAVDPASGTYDATVTQSANNECAGDHIAFSDIAAPIWVPAPLTIDGDDTTGHLITGHTEFYRLQLADSYRIGRARLVVECETAGAKSYALEGQTLADIAAGTGTEIASFDFTATGSFTADTVVITFDNSNAYQFYRLVGPDENRRIFTVELYEPTAATSADLTAHIADPTDAHDASAVSFAPTGTIAATTVQAAVAEVSGDVTDHLADTADAHDASAVSIVDAGGYFTGTDVEAALAELAVGTASEAIEVVAISGAAVTINCDTARIWDITLTANCTLTITNPPADQTHGPLEIVLRQGGVGSFTVTWPASVEWQDTDGTSGGAAPTLHTAVGAVDVVILDTHDGGVTWGGSHDSGSGGTPAPATGVGAILISDTPSTPLVFADLIQNEAQDDLVYADL